MSKNIKEFIIKNNINLFFLRENFLLFFKFLLLSNFSKILKKNVYRYFFFFCAYKKPIRCFLTGRGKGINLSLGISRIILRKLISEGALFGFKKSSW